MKALQMMIGVGVMMVTLELPAQAQDAGVAGGYLNSMTQEALVTLREDTRAITLYSNPLPIRLGVPTTKRQGQLYVVDAWGTVTAARAAVSDRSGHRVALPEKSYDKVVYMDRRGYIRAVMGVENDEALSFVSRNFQAPARVVLAAQDNDLFTGLAESSTVFTDMRASEDEIADMFITSIQWMVGQDAKALIAQLLQLAKVNGSSAIQDIRRQCALGGSAESAQAQLPGVGLIAQGGNGGGGTGLVAQGGNGGGGTGLTADVEMMAGAALSVAALPTGRGLNAMTSGKFLMVTE